MFEKWSEIMLISLVSCSIKHYMGMHIHIWHQNNREMNACVWVNPFNSLVLMLMTLKANEPMHHDHLPLMQHCVSHLWLEYSCKVWNTNSTTAQWICQPQLSSCSHEHLVREWHACQGSLAYIFWHDFQSLHIHPCTALITNHNIEIFQPCQHDPCSNLWGLHGCGGQVRKGLQPAKNTKWQNCRCSASLWQGCICQPSCIPLQPTHSVGGTGRCQEHVLAVCQEKGRRTWQYEADNPGIIVTQWWRGGNGVLNYTHKMALFRATTSYLKSCSHDSSLLFLLWHKVQVLLPPKFHHSSQAQYQRQYYIPKVFLSMTCLISLHYGSMITSPVIKEILQK